MLAGATGRSSPAPQREAPRLEYLAAVALRFRDPVMVGTVPDGVRFDFQVHGTVSGPRLNGTFDPCAAYLRIDREGVGVIHVRAPLRLSDGAYAELEATGRYDFGEDGYQRAQRGDLPDSGLGWCPRFLTGDRRYDWLNRAQCLGVGLLRPKQQTVQYDLYRIQAGEPG